MPSLYALRRHVNRERRRGRTWRSIASELGPPYGPLPIGEGALGRSLLWKIARPNRGR